MLRKTLIGLGIACLAFAAWASSRGWPIPSVLFPIVLGLILTLGVIYERHRYKRVETEPPGAGWVETGERVIDEESGKLVAVYYHPTTGERKYVQV